MARHPALALLALLLPLSSLAQAPPSGDATATFSSEALNLRFTYPASLQQTDASAAISSSHINILGISVDADPALARATACLHPLLLAKTPEAGASSTSTSETTPDGVTHTRITPSTAATILLAELDIHCVIEGGNADATDLLTRMAEVVDKTPGMSPITPPSWYNVARQKVHMAAAQGHPQADGQPSPFTLFTMGLSTNWNNHLLVWYFSSNSAATLNRMTHSMVRFGSNPPLAIYPLQVGYTRR